MLACDHWPVTPDAHFLTGSVNFDWLRSVVVSSLASRDVDDDDKASGKNEIWRNIPRTELDSDVRRDALLVTTSMRMQMTIWVWNTDAILLCYEAFNANAELIFALIGIECIQGVPSELRLGFVDLDFECSTVCPILPGRMGIWQKRLGSWARW